MTDLSRPLGNLQSVEGCLKRFRMGFLIFLMERLDLVNHIKSSASLSGPPLPTGIPGLLVHGVDN